MPLFGRIFAPDGTKSVDGVEPEDIVVRRELKPSRMILIDLGFSERLLSTISKSQVLLRLIYMKRWSHYDFMLTSRVEARIGKVYMRALTMALFVPAA